MDKSKEIKKLAKRIKSLRLQKGYSSYESFAYDNGIHRAQYGRYETGTDMQYTSLLKIAQAFDMTLEEFFSEGFD
ncbi:MAG: helix-turn-helix domain-containing protein [Flavobacteriaceae bacterium]|jgi:transcriptional regulator with XRE-family HTH domain|uniref:XRE family transcriptional regulator n=1 Tax=Flagellimonas alvinocaridis TaxID=2530200 RepID=A0A4S8RW53_9FLAO|nr:helix-turn-helix transcriptional regulator [Allomuricauda alvinocaridis]MCR9263822.1 helix-turn-helix domain-containing protein [Flavobacteriaceae bacterium]THV61495.1 XRE family transcriptional regulator [Allomuricauda alvinocaridis]